MPYLIDGHNLIPKLPGLSLQAPDDEMQLVSLLQEFCRLQRKEVEVFFDNAPPGQPRARVFGVVAVRFARYGSSADDEIQKRLDRLGRAARNWIVVSSDGQVQAAARAARAGVLSAEAFARQLRHSLAASPLESGKRPEPGTDLEDIDDWLALFGEE